MIATVRKYYFLLVGAFVEKANYSSDFFKTKELTDLMRFISRCLVLVTSTAAWHRDKPRSLKSENQKDVGSSLALDQKFLNACNLNFVRLFETFLMSPKGPLFNVFNILQQIEFSTRRPLTSRIFSVQTVQAMTYF